MDNDDFVIKKKGMTVKVINNNIESAIAQLKRRMNTEGINKELRKRKHFVPGSVIRRQKMAEAKLRWKKKYAQIMDIESTRKRKVRKQDKPNTKNQNNQNDSTKSVF